MDGFLIPLAIIWILLTAFSNKKNKQAKQEAKRRAQEAAQQQAEFGPQAAPERPAPVPVQPAQSDGAAFDPYFSDSERHVPDKQSPPVKRQSIETTVRSVESSMSDAPSTRTREAIGTRMRVESAQHPLEASSFTGHAHTETSLSGRFEPDCPPQSTVSRDTGRFSGLSRPVGPTFQWDATDVTRGIILAEILGKPKALQKRA